MQQNNPQKTKLNKSAFKDVGIAVFVIALTFTLYQLSSRYMATRIDNAFLLGYAAEASFALPIIICVFILKRTDIYRSNWRLLATGWTSGLPLIILLLINSLQLFTGNVEITASAREISLYIAQMVLIGYCEEVLFRGLLQGAFHKLYGENSANAVRLAAFSAGGLFGCLHLFNALRPEISLAAAATQAGAAVFMGFCFGAIYYRTGKNIWYSIFLHALNDTVVGVVNGTLGGRTLIEVIGESNRFGIFSAIIPVLFYGIVALVLLRPSKVQPLLSKNDNA